MQRTSDANTESIVKIKTKDIILEQQIQEDIKAAMKAKDTVALAATRAIKGEILLFKTSDESVYNPPAYWYA